MAVLFGKMLYTHATIVTVNTRREIITDGAILVRDSRVVDIGKSSDLLATHASEEQCNLSGHIVIPGLISTHMHTAQTLLRG